MALPERTTDDTPSLRLPQEPDPSSGFRIMAASIGLVLIGVGIFLCITLFYQIYRVLMDPRPLVEQVNRWEFVIRGRMNDVPVRPVEPGEAAKLKKDPAVSRTGEDSAEPDPLTPGQSPNRPRNEAEIAGQVAARLGSVSARPTALLLMFILLGILVRIAIGVLEAGGKLVNLAAGEKEFMQRLLVEITRRNKS